LHENRHVQPPAPWLHIAKPSQVFVPSKPLERGELEAIALAKELKADALLIDDCSGREEAVR